MGFTYQMIRHNPCQCPSTSRSPCWRFSTRFHDMPRGSFNYFSTLAACRILAFLVSFHLLESSGSRFICNTLSQVQQGCRSLMKLPAALSSRAWVCSPASCWCPDQIGFRLREHSIAPIQLGGSTRLPDFDCPSPSRAQCTQETGVLKHLV